MVDSSRVEPSFERANEQTQLFTERDHNETEVIYKPKKPGSPTRIVIESIGSRDNNPVLSRTPNLIKREGSDPP